MKVVRHGNRPAFAAFPGEGPHILVIATLDGKRVLQESGEGPRSYSLGGLERKTIYTLSGRSVAGDFSHRLLIP